MLVNIYAIYDDAAKAYMQPFFSATDGLAIRAVQKAVDDQNSDFHKHAQDYSLFGIGKFDDSKGTISRQNPSLVISLQQLKEYQPTPGEIDLDDLNSAGGTA